MRRLGSGGLRTAVVGACALGLFAPDARAADDSDDSAAIPAFARKYRTTCTTCHVAPPKLNALGEAFRLNGYRFPENDALLRRDRPVEQGAEPWKDLWPRAIWPGELPGEIPLAVRLVNDVTITAEPDATAVVSFQFPAEIYLLAAASLGETVSAFVSTEWTPDYGLDAIQAKVKIQNLVGALPDRALDLWVGLQNLYLFTLADRQIDRAGRLNFRWQTFRPSDIALSDPMTGETVNSANTFQLRETQPAIELSGVGGGGRLYYALGVAQGAGTLAGDNNSRKDVFYKLRYKVGGLRLDGLYDTEDAPVQGGGGQLRDRSLTLEHFGYFGGQPVADDLDDTHRAFGVNARLVRGPLDVATGFVWGQHDNPWGDLLSSELTHRSLFGRAEVMIYPWLMGSLKFDLFETSGSPQTSPLPLVIENADQTRILPGVIVLLRHNVKAVLEGELFARHTLFDEDDLRRPHALYLRLDVAF